MSGFPEAARTVRGGFVLLDPATARPVRVIPFQYNPETLTRTLQPQGIGNEPGDRLEALRLKGPRQRDIGVGGREGLPVLASCPDDSR